MSSISNNAIMIQASMVEIFSPIISDIISVTNGKEIKLTIVAIVNIAAELDITR